MYPVHPDDRTELATRAEAVREWAYNCDAPPHIPFLTHDWDVTVPNPRYDGPPQYPEDADADAPLYERGFKAAAARAKAAAASTGIHHGIIPTDYPGWFEVKAYPRRQNRA